MLTVYPVARSRGVVQIGDAAHPCALGRSGVRTDKREGDGATPLGTFLLRRALYRPDRLARPVSGLPLDALTRNDGWCDDPHHPAYNRHVTLPFAASHEVLWRDDGLYDVIIVLGHNDDPPRAGLGSAIFLHCATSDFAPTEGCIALARQTLLDLLPRFSPATALHVQATA